MQVAIVRTTIDRATGRQISEELMEMVAAGLSVVFERG